MDHNLSVVLIAGIITLGVCVHKYVDYLRFKAEVAAGIKPDKK